MRTLCLLALCVPGVGWACDAVVDATVHTPDGPQAGWSVVWEEGRITQVGAQVNVDGCAVHARPGVQVTPGLIAVSTQLGLVEVSAEAATRDDAWNADPVRAAFQPVLAYNPRSSVIPVTRLGGITSVLVHGAGGLVSGQIGWVKLSTGSQPEAVLAPYVAMGVDASALGSRAAALVRMGELFDDARQHAKGRSYEGLSELSASRLDLEALQPVLAGERPLWVRVNRASDIEAWLAFAKAQRVKLVIDGGAEAWLVAEALAEAQVPVVVDPMVYGPGSFDQIHGRADNAALLARAGVPVILGGHDTHNARALRVLAGNAVRGGMAHADALTAITATPAQALGLDGRGSLTVGAVADLAVWTADPLDIPARLVGLFIEGHAQPLKSRQTALVDAWRVVPRAWWPDPNVVAEP